MIDIYYKTISPSQVKKRIAKLVETEQKVYAKYKKVQDKGLGSATEYYFRKWFAYNDALNVMGITTVDYSED